MLSSVCVRHFLSLGHVNTQDVLARFLQTSMLLGMAHPILLNASRYETVPLIQHYCEQFANRSRSDRAGILPAVIVRSWWPVRPRKT
jgi:hypothetical protein